MTTMRSQGGKLNIPGLTDGLTMAVVAVVYFAAARLSLLLAFGNTNATPVWPPSGIALAAILLWGYRMGPAIFAGAFLANVLVLKGTGLASSYTLAASLVTAAGNLLEGILGAYLIRRFAGTKSPFDTLKELFVFIIFGSFVGPLVSASIGVASFCAVTGQWPLFAETWLTWWLGDAAGILTVAPLIIMMKKKLFPAMTRMRFAETGLAFFVLMVLSAWIFGFSYPLEYILIPPLIWIAIRLGRCYSASAILLVSGIAVICTVGGAGPLIARTSPNPLLYLQTFIGVISIVTLCLSVLMHERGEADESRATAQKQLSDIIEFLPDATFAIDRSGRVIAWNRAMEELSGVSKKDMIGKADYEYALPFFGERCPILIDFVIKGGDPGELEAYEHVVKKGGMVTAERYNPMLRRYLSGAAAVLIDREGNVSGAIESIRDITDRKVALRDLHNHKEHLEEIIKTRSAELVSANDKLIGQIRERDKVEAALSRSEKKYRDLVESAGSVILRWKPDGSVTFFNTYAQTFFGFTEAEIIGKNIVGTIVPALESSGRDLSRLIDDIIRHPEAHAQNENENIRKNGEKVWISWTNRPVFDESGALSEILSVGNDISLRKNIEESLKKTLNELALAKERAEAADRIKSAFLATMSHELRTPLNSIIGFTGIILQGLAGPLTGEQEKQLGMVRASARHLLSLINDVLDISKIEAGQLEVRNETFDLKTTMEKAVATLKPAAEKKGLTLNVLMENNLDGVSGDQRRVEQILLNLLTNAVKFTEHGTVTLRAARIPEYRSPAAGRAANAVPAIQLSITDTGMGIRGEDMTALFQPFRQLDTGLTRKSEGTGLGLAICRRLAELMGGEINAVSVWGQGSTFTFIMPLTGSEKP